jgi:hypothetical protein
MDINQQSDYICLYIKQNNKKILKDYIQKLRHLLITFFLSLLENAKFGRLRHL